MKKGILALLTVALLAQGSAFANEELDAMEGNMEEDSAALSFRPQPFPHPVPGPFVNYTCYAQNRRGQMFPAVGYDQISTQALAMQYCQTNSLLRCAPLGCQLTGF